MKIITKEQEKEIERLKQENRFLKRGYRAMSACIDYERIIVSILKTLNLNEIEIEDYLLLSEETLEVCETINNSRIIRLRGEKIYKIIEEME